MAVAFRRHRQTNHAFQHPPLSIGAIFGTTARWLLNLAVPASLSPATGNLFANWTGALLIGIFAETVSHPQWKLLLITGFSAA
ncbi:camphor resistance protein CrcB [Neisseria gonorrhoeae]|uniref:Fluoride-specific ion channel n=1 Tax=Neisseria gonorrhoeae TaxID=485 RepID=A0A378VW19_NEIGO|nr:camphor resistance protein CrcB [Neisseria gonorrhoeae]